MKTVTWCIVCAVLCVCSVFAVAAQVQFAYLEERESERAQAWVAKENARTAAVLEADPRYQKIYRELLDEQQRNVDAEQAGRSLPAAGLTMIRGWIYHLRQDEQHPRGLWRRATVESYSTGRPQWEPLIDLDDLSRVEGRSYSSISISAASCRPRGDRCMVTLMEKGDISKIFAREFDFDKRRFVEHGFALVSEYVAYQWQDDDTLLLDQEMLEPAAAAARSERVLRSWRRGQRPGDAQDVFRISNDSSGVKGALAYAETFSGGAASRDRVILFTARRSNVGGQYANRYWLWKERKTAAALLLPEFVEVRGLFAGQLVIYVDGNWTIAGNTVPQGSYVSVSLDQAIGGVREVSIIRAPANREELGYAVVTAKGVLIPLTRNVRGELWGYTFDRHRWTPHRVPMPENGVVGPIIVGDDGDEVAIVSYQDMIHPPTSYLVRAGGAVTVLPSAQPELDSQKWIMMQREARSSDGTAVPYFIAQLKDLKYDGNAATLLLAYGAFGASMLPTYDAAMLPWLKRGGVYVVANIRGGGEFGPSWHVVRTERRHTYEDFVAVAQDLITRKVTSPRRLGISGHSAGGLLAGVMLTQHPKLFNAAVLSAPVTDFMSHKSTTREEYGREEIPAERAFMEQTSPLENLRKVENFPEPLILTSTLDMNVHPGQSRRFAAKAASLGLPYLFFETAEGGHALGANATQRAAVDALITTYLVRRLMDVSGGIEHPKPFTVQDSIAWSYVLPFSSGYGSLVRDVALYSPDGKYFVLQTRRGDLTRNVNVDSLLLYTTHDVEQFARSTTSAGPPQPVVLARIDAVKDEDSLSGTQWLSNTQLGFVSRGPDGRRQAFAVDVATRSLKQVTTSTTDVMGFAHDGDALVYYACVPYTKQEALTVLVDSFDKTLPTIQDNSEANCYTTTPIELFGAAEGQAAIRLPLPAMRLYPDLKRIWLAPSGDYGVIVAPATNAPVHWADYTGPAREQIGFDAHWVRDDAKSMDLLNRTRYLLVDVRKRTIRPLLDAPTGQMSLNGTPLQAFWRKDSRSVIVTDTFLPLNGVESSVRLRRRGQPAITEIDITTGAITPISFEAVPADTLTPPTSRIVGFDWNADADRLTVVHEHRASGTSSRETYQRNGSRWKRAASVDFTPDRRVKVEQQQDLNERPRIYATTARSGQRKLLFDPNPQADGLSFARTEIMRWQDANGTEWMGGLLLPSGYDAGKRYPLVVQTHGFKPHKFLLDGPAYDGQGGTAFAAQALASAGFIVLQVEDNAKTITEDAREGPAVAEGFRSAIERLIADGKVDASNVGMIAFSRTGWHALHLAAHYPNMLAALTMSDTLYVGYSIYSYNLANPPIAAELAKLTGGKPDFSNIGDWFAKNPVYALGRSRAAVRLEGMIQGLGMWEMYAVLRDAGRPAEFVLYPDGSHVLQKPEERLSSQGGNLDWLRFWLQDYEDPALGKREQYRRWRELRAVAQAH